MKPSQHDASKLDVERFATDKAELHGAWPLTGMVRLAGACHTEGGPAADAAVQWQAIGERRRRGAGQSDPWLLLRLGAEVQLTCQRCLGPVATSLEVSRWFHFVVGEDQAAKLDAESEDDVLASVRALDLHQLAEDELLLALPLVPRHDVCPHPLRQPEADLPGAEGDAPNPFAALAALKRGAH